MTIEIANRLIELRKRKGLSQEELAEKLGISRQAVSKWERAESGPDVDNAILLSRLYNISLDELFNNKPEYERELDMMEPDPIGETEDEPQETAEEAATEEPDNNEEAAEEPDIVIEHTTSTEHSFTIDLDNGAPTLDGIDEIFRKASAFSKDVVNSANALAKDAKEAAREARRAAREAGDEAREAAREARWEARSEAYNNEETAIPADAQRITDASYEGIRRLVCNARANLRIIGTDGDICAVSCSGPEKERERCFVYTVGDTLHIETEEAKRRFFFNVSGPIKLNVNVCMPDSLGIEANLKGGDLRVENAVTDALSAKTGGGDIEVVGCSADQMSLKTGGGDVSVSDTSAQRAEIVCGGGDIEAEGLDTAALLTVQTGGGDVKLIGSAKCVEATTGGGDVELDMNAEGIKARSGGGDLSIRCAGARNVNAKTGGGDIELKLSGCTGVTADIASIGGEALLDYMGERSTSGRKLQLALGDGSTMVEMRSAGGDVIVKVE